MSDHTFSDSLVNHLAALAARDDSAARGALAALRGSLRVGRALDALPVVLPVLGGGVGPQREDDAILLAGLFALHPERGSSWLAAALRQVKSKTGSDSVEGRFRALLGASRTELAPHLRHAVALVAGHGHGLDWGELHHAIRNWADPGDFVRRRWARAFWAADKDAPASEPAPTTVNPI